MAETCKDYQELDEFGYCKSRCAAYTYWDGSECVKDTCTDSEYLDVSGKCFANIKSTDIRSTMKLDGDIDTFDQETFKNKLVEQMGVD